MLVGKANALVYVIGNIEIRIFGAQGDVKFGKASTSRIAGGRTAEQKIRHCCLYEELKDSKVKTSWRPERSGRSVGGSPDLLQMDRSKSAWHVTSTWASAEGNRTHQSELIN